MATTITAIVADIVARLIALAPGVETPQRYKPFREQGAFRDWAEAHEKSCFRSFSVVETGEVSPPAVSNTDNEWVETDIEILVAYPTGLRLGSGVDLRRVIAADLAQIDAEIGGSGYQARSPGLALGTIQTLGQAREDGPPVTFGVLRLHAGFYRSNSI